MIGLGLSLTGQRTSASLASLLFGMNEPGFTFEPWDITTLFQDRAGTTPVTAAGQSVGLRLDKSGRGNHEVAVSDAKRGTYGWMPKTGRRNLLTYTEQFDNAVWIKVGGGTGSASVVTANTAIAPNGTLTADTIVFTLNGGTTSGDISQLSCSVSTLSGDAAWSLYLKTSDNSTVTMSLLAPSGVLSKITITGAWQRFSVTGSGGTTPRLRLRGDDGVSNSASVHAWGAQLELGSTVTAYQRVVSQYDITEAGVPTCYYVQADGVDDAYVTPTITPNTDKVQVFAGVRKLSDAARGMVIELGNNVPNTFLVDAPFDATFTHRFTSRGSFVSTAQTSPGSFTGPITSLISGIGDISGDLATLRLNGSQVGQNSADQGTGNYLAYPAYIYSRGGTALPFNGLDFGHAVRFGPNLDAATIARVEALIARNTPEVTL